MLTESPRNLQMTVVGEFCCDGVPCFGFGKVFKSIHLLYTKTRCDKGAHTSVNDYWTSKSVSLFS